MKSNSKILVIALLRVIQNLVAERFYGQITIEFRDGEPVVINQAKQIKLR